MEYYIILSGVPLIIGEIVPAFRSIVEKIVPNAKPDLDCPVVLPYAPNAVLIGFIVSFIDGIVGLFILGFIDASLMLVALILPGGKMQESSKTLAVYRVWGFYL